MRIVHFQVTLAASLFSQVFGYRQPYDYLKALRSFQAGWLDPARMVQAVESPALAHGIEGRVDMMTTFVGNQLNTEFLYGFWLGFLPSINSTSLIGSPINQTIQSLVIEPPVVSVSAVANLAYPTINFTLPLQIDMIMRFGNDLKIESYDATLRRFPEAFEYILPKLLPQIARELNQTYGTGAANATSLLTLRAATDICNVATQYCTSDNLQYQSHDQCMGFLTQSVPFGNAWQGAQDTIWCRYISKNVVRFRPDVHCPSIGPSGGDMCIARDYINTTNSFPFSSTLIAPNASYSASDMSGLSSESIDQVLKIRMQTIVSTTLAFYAVPTMVLFVILYVSAKATEWLLARVSVGYSKLSFEHKRNTVTYVLNTIFTTIALGCLLVGTPSFARIYTYRGEFVAMITATIISALYIFELTYRSSLRPEILTHHFCTLFAIMTFAISLQVMAHPATLTLGAIWLYQATTEQSIFVGLFLYRIRYPRHALVRRTLYFAAVQSFIVKFSFCIYLLVWWGLHLAEYHTPTDIFISVTVCVVGNLILFTQIYGSWAVWSIGAKMSHHDAHNLRDAKPRSWMPENWSKRSLRALVGVPGPISQAQDSNIESGPLTPAPDIIMST